MPGALAVDGGLCLSGRCKHAHQREIMASRGSLREAPVPRREAESTRQRASHNPDDPDGGVSELCSFPSAALLMDALIIAYMRGSVRQEAQRESVVSTCGATLLGEAYPQRVVTPRLSRQLCQQP